MRSWLVIVALTVQVEAEPRWQQVNAPVIRRVWGVDDALFGVGPGGVHRSTDGGATWVSIDRAPANGIWGDGDLWVVRDRSIHRFDGAAWTNLVLPVSFATKLEGMWGAGPDRYVFGSERGTGVLLHSRDRGATWTSESIALSRVTSVWGRGSEVFAVGGDVMRSTGDGIWISVHRGELHAIGGTSKMVYAVGGKGTIVAFDGTTWTRRASGVTYALSSITASGAVYAGSDEGPPLRSVDGVTWRPVTALVPRGHVWESSTATIAVAGEVHVLATPLPVVVPTNPLGMPAVPSLPLAALDASSALRLRFKIDDDDKLPYRHDLLRIATSRFGDGYAVLPRLAHAGKPPALRIDEIKDCGTYPPRWSSRLLIPARLTCSSTCGMVKVNARIGAGPVSQSTQVANSLAITSCSDQALGTQTVVERIERDLANAYLSKLYLAIEQTKPGTDTRIEALAHYLLEGGDSMHAKRALAAELGVAETWSGLFWNAAPPPSPIKPVCTYEQLFEQDAKESEQRGRHGDALTTYEAILGCYSGYLERAVRAACRAGASLKAKWHYSNLPEGERPRLLEICKENGIDPR